jgi:ribosomal protein S18 acetylase RimI-like enzyme
MNKFSEYRWWKAGEVEKSWPEMFLKSREAYCVAACARYLGMSFLFDRLWVLSSGGESVTSLLFQSGRTLFPVFGGQTDIKIPPYMGRVLGDIPIHALQGLRSDVDLLEETLIPFGFAQAERVDFDLMTIDRQDMVFSPVKIPAGVKLKAPLEADIEKILPLQAAYEIEEVLPSGAIFNAKLCRARLERMFKKEKMLTACVNDRIVGKINTNARSFSRYQIGGVYVMPEYRGRGIAGAMTAAFSRLLLAHGVSADGANGASADTGITLFVKKHNTAAQKVYRRAGFKKMADYCISYM